MSTFQFDTEGEIGPFTWDHLTPVAKARLSFEVGNFWSTLDSDQKDRLAHFGPIAFSDITPRALIAAISTDDPVRLAINADGHLDLEEPR